MMKYAKLVYRNLFRNKIRTGLMIVLLAAIFAIVASLIQIVVALDKIGDSAAGSDRLVVQSAYSIATALPYAHELKIRQVPGVVDVAKSQWLGGYWKEPKNAFAIIAVDAEHFANVFADYGLSDGDNRAFIADRRGAIAGEKLMKKYGWKVGDRVHIHRQLFPFDPDLVIRGVTHHATQNEVLFLHLDYMNETLKWNRAGTMWVRVADRNRMPAISQAIDAEFRNSNDPTETFTEKEFNRQFVNMFGNVKLLLTSISLCSILMVILLAAITMSMAARERVTEVAVLKAIGFQRPLILSIMLSEFVLTTLIGCALGTGLVALFFSAIDIAPFVLNMLQNFHISASTAGICAGIAVAVGLIAGGMPATKAANLSVVNGLRKVV
jgi:putative ABC transport system permease protein